MQVVDELFEAWNAHDLDRFASLCAPECGAVDVGEAAPLQGREAIRAWCARYLNAFPDLQLGARLKVVEDSNVAVSWTATGTHRGGLMHIPPTGRAVRIEGALFLTIEDGMVRQLFSVWDSAGLLRSLGLLPDL